MSIDFFSLRMLIVSDRQSERDLLRRAATQGAVPVDVSEADGLAAARPQIATGDPDILFLSAAMTPVERAALISAADAKTLPPLVILIADGEFGHGLPDGVDGVIPAPCTDDEARALVDGCINMRMPKRALLVDDSKTMRAIVKKILSASRFRLEVSEAAEGAQALDQLRGGRFNIVFLDYNMPGLDGMQTLSEIKRHNPEVGVIIMSSATDDELARRARGAGAAAFLKKPFYPADIDKVLRTIMAPRPMA